MADTKPPERDIPAPEELSKTQPIRTHTSSTHGASPSTKLLQIRSRHKRMRMESPTPQPRHAPPQNPLSSQNPSASLSTLQKGDANPSTPETHTDLAQTDLITEQTNLLHQNAAALSRFVDPHTPPNLPRILTENGLLTHTPVYKDSPEENTDRKSWREVVFGDWLPGHGPEVNNSLRSPVFGRDKGEDEEFVRPARMLIRLRGFYADVELRDRGLWVAMVLVVARGSRDGEGVEEGSGSEDVGSTVRQPRPWEL